MPFIYYNIKAFLPCYKISRALRHLALQGFQHITRADRGHNKRKQNLYGLLNWMRKDFNREYALLKA